MQYRFLNLQPLGEIEEDCVCRAISFGVNLPYYEIQKKLNLTAQLFDCEELCVCCYKHLLDSVFKLPRIESFQGYTVEEFINMNPNGKYIIRVSGHLTACENSILYDIWDCRNETVDIVWEVI